MNRKFAIILLSVVFLGSVSFDGEEINDDRRCTSVFAQDNGRWKSPSEHCTQIVAK